MPSVIVSLRQITHTPATMLQAKRAIMRAIDHASRRSLIEACTIYEPGIHIVTDATATYAFPCRTLRASPVIQLRKAGRKS